MAAFDPLSQEVVYALKGNVAYPLTTGSASAIASLAQSRLNDAYSPSGVTATVPASAITVVKQ